MEYDATDSGPCKKRVQVTLVPEEVDEEFTKSYAQLRSKIVLPGFRRGRAPRRILERKFGEQVRGDVTQELLEKNIKSIIAELELKVVSPPTLVDEEDLKDAAEPGKELLFSFEVETKPEF